MSPTISQRLRAAAHASRAEHGAAARELSQTDAPLLKAFALFGLDHDNPSHWRPLLEGFADAFFARARRGRRKRWDEHSRERLLADFDEYRRVRPARLSALQVCEAMIFNGGAYAGVKPCSLLRQVQSARNASSLRVVSE